MIPVTMNLARLGYCQLFGVVGQPTQTVAHRPETFTRAVGDM